MKRKFIAVILVVALTMSGSALALAAEDEGMPAENDIDEEIVPDSLMNPPKATKSILETNLEDDGQSEDDGNEDIHEGEVNEEELGLQVDRASISGSSDNGLAWDLTDGTLTFSGTGVIERLLLSDDQVQSITSVIIGDGITEIGENAFQNYRNLVEVTIPKDMTVIGDYAFENCSNLRKISIPEGVLEIGSAAFATSGLESISIPNSVRIIGDYAFADCRSLSTVILSNNITKIDAGVFNGCRKLTDISIPNGVTEIGVLSFANCTDLQRIIIPNSVKVIGDGAFAYCRKLHSVIFEGDAPDSVGADIFAEWGDEEVIITASYPDGNETWTEEVRRAYGENLRWIAVSPKTEPLRIIPEVTDNTYVIGSEQGVTIKCSGELKDFVSVYMDGVEVERSNYTLQEGSTILTFMTKYLDTLSVGRHKVTLDYTYGSVDTELTILAKSSSSGVTGSEETTSGNSKDGTVVRSEKAPQTGDNALILLWLLTAIFAIGTCVMMRYKKHIA